MYVSWHVAVKVPVPDACSERVTEPPAGTVGKSLLVSERDTSTPATDAVLVRESSVRPDHVTVWPYASCLPVLVSVMAIPPGM